MKWFIVIAMLSQHNPTSTPLWIPYINFNTKEECIQYAKANHNGLFMKAFKEYQMKIPPKQISCINETTMKQIQMMMNESRQNEKISI